MTITLCSYKKTLKVGNFDFSNSDFIFQSNNNFDHPCTPFINQNVDPKTSYDVTISGVDNVEVNLFCT